ncbi:MAG TPA: polysaccharide lyase family protein [Phycisphaerae bacterium]|nr:polysaccharide lyase family protein [Phycisphaerae bacterium]
MRKGLARRGMFGGAVCVTMLAAAQVRAADAPVTLTDNGDTWTLDNGIVKATINKRTSNMPSLIYHGVPIVGRSEFWEQTPSGKVTASVTIDPAKNGGQRGEVDVKGVGGGRMDIEVRYTMERGVSGFYTYAVFSHPASYAQSGEGESRFILQMNPTFDWLSVDQDRNMPMVSNADERAGVVVHAKEQRIMSTGIYKNSVEHKYSYCAVMYKLPAYGWSSIKDHIGVWFINPSCEYIGGDASKLDLVCHMGATLLDYWTSGHYAGGAGCNIPAGQAWSKTIGPIFVYFNALDDPQPTTPEELATLQATEGNPTVPASWTHNANALFQDAIAKGLEERKKWPYDWVQGIDYPHKNERGNVSGQFVLDDPQAASTKLPHLTVGLAHPDYQGVGTSFERRSGNGDIITWQHDGDFYQFWNDGADDGKFTITNIRPGSYTLHAFADGVLGEFERANITVKAGENLDLGTITWTPVRYGKQLWDIGYPDRTGGKFLKGDGRDYWLWGWCLRYPLLFPHDVTYTIGQSDYHKDWFFEEVPHSETTAWLNPEAKDPANQRFGWVKAESLQEYPQSNQTGPWRVYGRGRATTWTIRFNMDAAARGRAVFRLALAGADGNGGLQVGVNGKDVGTIHPVATNALRYNTDTGVWRQYALPFDAAVLKPGENEMTLTVPAGDLTTGVVYDYLRLELDESKAADAPLEPALLPG